MKKIFFIVLLIFILSNIYSENESPFELSLKKESLIIGAGLGFNLLSLAIESSDDKNIRADEANISELDKLWYEKNLNDDYTLLSNIFFGAEVLLPLSFIVFEDKKDFITLSVMYGETLLLSNGIKETIKSSVRKERPYAYGDDEEYDKDIIRSFPSGHTTLAFSSAMFTSYVYSEMYPYSKYKYLVYAGSFTLAGATAASRIAAGKHFISDIAAGAALGTAIGFLVPFSHKINNNLDLSMGLNEVSMSYTIYLGNG